MKKNKLWHIVWIVGIYAILITILYLVIIYKVKWEHRDLNTYLYFYNCSNKLCSTTTKQDNYYSKVICNKDICPYIKDINDNKLILKKEDKSFIFDYMAENIINDNYLDYEITTNKQYYIVTNEENKKGIIDLEGKVVIEPKYDNITDYKNELLVYKDKSKYGIIKDDEIYIKPEYDDIIIINNEYFAYKDNNKYYISNYNNTVMDNKEYSYIYSYNGFTLVVNNKTIDILNDKLNTVLVMKINTPYEYNKVGEINSLNAHGESNKIYFTVENDNNITNYIFDTKNKKLSS